MFELSYQPFYVAYETVKNQENSRTDGNRPTINLFHKYIKTCNKRTLSEEELNGFTRIQRCRDALNSLDSQGWNRSFHQRVFHDQFIRATARVFFKNDPPGSFARAHQALLEINHWDTLSQEVLISTPRRFGKTISVSMFAAAMIYACPNIEVSIYSTCKRISQKLLRNVQKFLALIYKGLKMDAMKEVRSNMEEIVLQGYEGSTDTRIVNSYPSKVGAFYYCYNRRCLTANVFCRVPSHIVYPRFKMSTTYCSASVCRAFLASVDHILRQYGPCLSYMISCTIFLNTVTGMLNSLGGRIFLGFTKFCGFILSAFIQEHTALIVNTGNSFKLKPVGSGTNARPPLRTRPRRNPVCCSGASGR